MITAILRKLHHHPLYLYIHEHWEDFCTIGIDEARKGWYVTWSSVIFIYMYIYTCYMITTREEFSTFDVDGARKESRANNKICNHWGTFKLITMMMMSIFRYAFKFISDSYIHILYTYMICSGSRLTYNPYVCMPCTGRATVQLWRLSRLSLEWIKVIKVCIM